MAEEGPPGEDLVEGVLAVHRVPAAEPILSLEVRRRGDVASDDLVRDTRCIDLERPHGPVRHSIARCLVPVRVAEAPWRVLEQRGDDVGPIRGERGVGEGGDRRLEIRVLGDPAVLRVIECPLEVVEARCDDDPPVQALAVDAADRRQALQDEGHLRHHAGRADVLDAPAQSRADLGRVDESKKGLLGVGV
jgi:hypothetical protein